MARLSVESAGRLRLVLTDAEASRLGVGCVAGALSVVDRADAAEGGAVSAWRFRVYTQGRRAEELAATTGHGRVRRSGEGGGELILGGDLFRSALGGLPIVPHGLTDAEVEGLTAPTPGHWVVRLRERARPSRRRSEHPVTQPARRRGAAEEVRARARYDAQQEIAEAVRVVNRCWRLLGDDLSLTVEHDQDVRSLRARVVTQL